MAYKLKDDELRISVDGLPGLRRAFKDLGMPIKEITEANKESGNIVAAQARQMAPVRSGNLRKTIRVAGVSTHVAIRVGTKSVPYANPIHWGWFYDRDNSIRKNIKPNPFMARALGYTRAEVFDTYVKNIKRLIDSVTSKRS